MQPEEHSRSQIEQRKQLNLQNSKINGIYTILQVISQSSHAIIHRGLMEGNDELQEVLIKFYDLKKIESTSGFHLKEMVKRVTKIEADLMQKITHRNILKCYQVCENRNYKLLVLESHSCISLEEEICKKPFGEKDAVFVIKQIISGLNELQNQGVVHVSLKPSHIFNHNGEYKIVEFGYRQMMKYNEKKQLLVKGLTATKNLFIAPQIHHKQLYTTKAQVWTIGTLLYFMLIGQYPCGERPFESVCPSTILGLSGEAVEFINVTLCRKAEIRLDWNSMIHHPLIKSSIYLPNKIVISTNLNNLKKNDLPNSPKRYEDQLTNFERMLEERYEYGQSKLDIEPRQDSKLILSRFQDNLRKTPMQTDIAEHYYLYFKVSWIYTKVLSVFKEKCGIDETKREIIEFKYLVLSRCCSDLYKIKSHYEAIQDFNHNPYVKQLICRAQKLYDKVHCQWKICSQRLTKTEKKVANFFKDGIIKRLFKKEYSLHQKLMVGIEGIDFCKADQIEYTIQIYYDNISSVMERIVNEKPEKLTAEEFKQLTDLIRSFPYYQQINDISFERHNSNKDFSELVQNLIQKQ